LRLTSFSLRRRTRSSARAITHSSSFDASCGLSASQWSNGSRSVFDDALRLDRRQPILGLADEFRLADEHREHAAGRDHHVVAGDDRGAFVAVSSA
jgi:hypothetical protein